MVQSCPGTDVSGHRALVCNLKVDPTCFLMMAQVEADHDFGAGHPSALDCDATLGCFRMEEFPLFLLVGVTVANKPLAAETDFWQKIVASPDSTFEEEEQCCNFYHARLFPSFCFLLYRD